MGLTPEELARLATDSVAVAVNSFGNGEFEDDQRSAYERLVADRWARRKHPNVVRAIERLLAVDMLKSPNRKGAVPTALGLVKRRSKATLVRNLAIALMVDRLQDHYECDPRTGQGSYPYLTLFDASHAVVLGFYNANLYRRLTQNYVLKIAGNPFR